MNVCRLKLHVRVLKKVAGSVQYHRPVPYPTYCTGNFIKLNKKIKDNKILYSLIRYIEY